MKVDASLLNHAKTFTNLSKSAHQNANSRSSPKRLYHDAPIDHDLVNRQAANPNDSFNLTF